MPTQIEIRCAKRCDSAGPIQVAPDDKTSLCGALATLSRLARCAGWRRTREGWVCPACVRVHLTRPAIACEMITVSPSLPATDPPPRHFSQLCSDAHTFAQLAGYAGNEVKLKQSTCAAQRRVVAWDIYVRTPGADGRTRARIGSVICK